MPQLNSQDDDANDCMRMRYRLCIDSADPIILQNTGRTEVSDFYSCDTYLCAPQLVSPHAEGTNYSEAVLAGLTRMSSLQSQLREVLPEPSTELVRKQQGVLL